jgi:hypothetical protein
MPWSKLAELPLVVGACEYERLHAILAHESERITTHVWLIGAGPDGLGADAPSPARTATRCTRPAEPR